MTERMIGLCMAAGGVTVGFDLILGEIRRGRVKFLLIARDASERTRKQLTDKCRYYNVRFFITQYDSADLAHILGKSAVCAAAAFTGRGPWECVCRTFEAEEPQKTDECCDDRKDD